VKLILVNGSTGSSGGRTIRRRVSAASVERSDRNLVLGSIIRETMRIADAFVYTPFARKCATAAAAARAVSARSIAAWINVIP